MLRACLCFCFTKYVASRKAHLSVWCLSLLFLSYKLSLFRIVLLISWVILGSDGFVLIVCCVTFCSIPDYKAPLKSSQSKLIDLLQDRLKRTSGKGAYGSQVPPPPASFSVHKQQSWFLLAYQSLKTLLSKIIYMNFCVCTQKASTSLLRICVYAQKIQQTIIIQGSNNPIGGVLRPVQKLQVWNTHILGISVNI